MDAMDEALEAWGCLVDSEKLGDGNIQFSREQWLRFGCRLATT
jgi:hypothetical protein